MKMKDADAEEWKKTMVVEYESLIENNSWEKITSRTKITEFEMGTQEEDWRAKKRSLSKNIIRRRGH